MWYNGFGTCLAGDEGQGDWWQQLYYADFTYSSPWFHHSPALPGPDNNNVRTYTGPSDYRRSWGGRSAPPSSW